MNNSDFLEEIFFEGHRLGITAYLREEGEKEINRKKYHHHCDAYYVTIIKIIKEMGIKESIYLPEDLPSKK